MEELENLEEWTIYKRNLTHKWDEYVWDVKVNEYVNATINTTLKFITSITFVASLSKVTWFFYHHWALYCCNRTQASWYN